MRKALVVLLLVFGGVNALFAQAPPPPGPSDVYTIGADSICHGDTTLLVVVDTTLHGTMHISWSPSTGLSCDTCDTVHAYPTVTTHYTLIAHDSLKSDTNTIVITVDTLAVPSVNLFYSTNSYSGDTFYGVDSFYGLHAPYACGNTSLFIATPVNGGLNPVIIWKVNGPNAFGIIDTVIIVSNTDTLSIQLFWRDTVSCELIANYNCFPSDTVYYTYPTALSCEGISNISIDNSITLSPNPGSGIFSLSISQPSKQMAIELWNMQGQLLYTEQKQWEPAFTKQYNFSDLAKGVYLLKVSTENGVTVKRLILQ